MSVNKLTEEQFSDIYNTHLNTVYVLCYSFMKNKHDTDDAVQETFIKLIKNGNNFQSDQHMKAWLIVTASNICKNMLKQWWRKTESLNEEEIELPPTVSEENTEILEMLLRLPEKYKAVLHMYYYEEYSTAEIAKILEKKESTVRTLLARGRELLKKEIRSDDKCLN